MSAIPDSSLRAYSAGSDPIEAIRAETQALLESLSISTAQLYPKHWGVFAKQDARVMGFVFTVCDKAAGRSQHAGPFAIQRLSPAISRRVSVRFETRSTSCVRISIGLAVLDRMRLQQQATAIGQSAIPSPEEPCHE